MEQLGDQGESDHRLLVSVQSYRHRYPNRSNPPPQHPIPQQRSMPARLLEVLKESKGLPSLRPVPLRRLPLDRVELLPDQAWLARLWLHCFERLCG